MRRKLKRTSFVLKDDEKEMIHVITAYHDKTMGKLIREYIHSEYKKIKKRESKLLNKG